MATPDRQVSKCKNCGATFLVDRSQFGGNVTICSTCHYKLPSQLRSAERNHNQYPVAEPNIEPNDQTPKATVPDSKTGMFSQQTSASKPGGSSYVLSIIFGLFAVCLACLAPIWLFSLFLSELNKPVYYNYSPIPVNSSSDMQHNLAENQRIPMLFKQKMGQHARDYVELNTREKVFTTFLDSSSPSEEGSKWERFTVVAVINDGNGFLQRKAYHLTYLVDVSRPHFTYQVETIRFESMNETSNRY